MSKRSRKNKRIKSHSKISKSRLNLLNRLKQNFANLDVFKNAEPIRSEEMGQVSLSDVFVDYISPYRRFATKTDAFYKLLAVACVGWNAGLLPPDERKEMLDNVRKTMPDKQTLEDFDAIVDSFIERKQKHYAEHTRMILDYELTDLGDDYHISVVSMIEESTDRD